VKGKYDIKEPAASRGGERSQKAAIRGVQKTNFHRNETKPREKKVKWAPEKRIPANIRKRGGDRSAQDPVPQGAPTRRGGEWKEKRGPWGAEEGEGTTSEKEIEEKEARWEGKGNRGALRCSEIKQHHGLSKVDVEKWAYCQRGASKASKGSGRRPKLGKRDTNEARRKIVSHLKGVTSRGPEIERRTEVRQIGGILETGRSGQSGGKKSGDCPELCSHGSCRRNKQAYAHRHRGC